MTLPARRLDDLTWTDLVEGAVRRIPQRSSGQWTLHAPVDPGVTLLELFAWQLEQRGYWLDQVPDSMVRALLALAGEAPRPACSAAVVLAFGVLGDSPHAVVREHDLVKLRRRSGPDLVFTLDQEMTALPLESSPRVLVGNSDISVDLDASGAPLFEGVGNSGELEIEIQLRSAPPKVGTLGVLFELVAPSQIQGSWHPDAPEAKDVPPPANLSWMFSRGKERTSPPRDVSDGTGGFRRSGIVRLPLPKDWAPKKNGGDTYSIFVSPTSSTFSEPPRLRGVHLNVARATHRVRRAYRVEAKNWLPLPGREITLPPTSAHQAEKLPDNPALVQSIKVSIPEQAGAPENGSAWCPTDDFHFHGPGDHVFVASRERQLITFGDGLRGRIPVLPPHDEASSQPPPAITVEYDVGGGVEGNVRANIPGWQTCWTDQVTDQEREELEVTNPVASVGGRDPETLQEARNRVGDSLRARHRAVTESDYRTLAESTPGVAVARAHVAVGYLPSHRCLKVPGAVTVFVLPELVSEWDETPSPIVPDKGLLSAVRKRLAEARLVGSEVYVLPPLYREVRVSALVAAANSDRPELRELVDKFLERYLHPLVGGDDEAGWPFGAPIRPSALVRMLQGELGETAEVLQLNVEVDPNEKQTALVPPRFEKDDRNWCLDVDIGRHRLPVYKPGLIRFEPPRTPRGGLQ